MTESEKHAAEQLDAAITARQAGRAQPPLDAVDPADAALAASLVDAARSSTLNPSFAAQLERNLMQQYERQSESPLGSFRHWWEDLMNALGQGLNRSVGWAVAAALFIALASFVLIRNVQTAGPSASVTLLPTRAPLVLNATATQPAATPSVEPSVTSVIAAVVSPTATITPTAVPAQVTATPLPAQPTATRTPTTAPTRAPTAAPSRAPSATPSRTPTSTAAGTITSVKITMLDVDGTTPGKHIGCGDTVVMVDRTIPPTTAPLSAAIREQLSIHDQFYGQSGLQNAIYRSTLQFVSASIVNGHATINLTGTIRTGGLCDAPRVAAQFEETALQFSTVTSVTTYVNGVEINQAMSQK